MRPLRVAATLAFAGSLGLFAYALAPHVSAAEELDLPDEPTQVEEVIEPAPPAEPQWVDHVIRRGETLSGLLSTFGVDAPAVLAAAAPHLGRGHIRAGDAIRFLVDPQRDAAISVQMSLDEDRTLNLNRDTAGAWTAQVDELTYTHETSTRSFTVRHSLWRDAVDAGLRPADIAALAKVFEYDLDFNTELRAGAQVSLVVQELWREGALARLGAPLAIVLTNAGKRYEALRFENSEGEVAYVDAKGVARRKAFLRSPLEFSRVTSGFTLARYHPILKKSRPHLGVDFGAPTGTPIRAVADGKVETAGKAGGHGNYVKIQHLGPQATSYSHLSKIAVQRGATVRQGQIIGYVGATGLATGPHLHYQMWVNGRHVNPMTVDLPMTESLSPADRSRFEAEKARLFALLDPGSPPVADAAAE
jgi:murein DD-endopeptidase MepM/ murein hydrolase activator NlpD